MWVVGYTHFNKLLLLIRQREGGLNALRVMLDVEKEMEEEVFAEKEMDEEVCSSKNDRNTHITSNCGGKKNFRKGLRVPMKGG